MEFKTLAVFLTFRLVLNVDLESGQSRSTVSLRAAIMVEVFILCIKEFTLGLWTLSHTSSY